MVFISKVTLSYSNNYFGKALDTHKKALILALEKSLGVVTTACKAAGIHRSVYYFWYESDPLFKAAVDDVKNVSLDFAESQLFKLMQGYSLPHDHVSVVSQGKGKESKIVITPGTKHVGPDATSTIFYLKTQGKKRGYVEKTEVDHSFKDKVKITIGGKTLKKDGTTD